MPQVQDVTRARAVDVGEADPLRIELVRGIEDGASVHCDFAPEAAIAVVRLVADLAVADAYDVDEPVTAHVDEKDGFGAVREHDCRAL